MSTRTVENEKDRRMTVILATFMPCGAKMEIIAMMMLVCFPGSKWAAPGMYFLGLAIVVISSIALKKTKRFAGEPAPFVMELPACHLPTVKGVLALWWNQFGTWISTGSFGVGTAVAIVLLAAAMYFLFRPMPRNINTNGKVTTEAGA